MTIQNKSKTYSQIMISNKPEKSDPVVSIVIPALNEEMAIMKTLAEIPFESLPPTEILVVDGYSTDRTRELAEKMGAKIIMEKRKGYGRAIQTGVEHSKGNIIVWMDADYTYPATWIPEIIKPIIENKADLVIGNRLNKLESESMIISHRFGNIFLTLFFDFLYGQMVKDTQCGLRAFSKIATNKLNLNRNGMSFATEILIESVKNKLRIEQVDISYRKRIGETKLNTFRDGFNIIYTILRNKIIRRNGNGHR